MPAQRVDLITSREGVWSHLGDMPTLLLCSVVHYLYRPTASHPTLLSFTKQGQESKCNCCNVINWYSSTVELKQGTVDGSYFLDFLRGALIPRMQPFPNINSVLSMDNCSIHHTQEVKRFEKDSGSFTVSTPLKPWQKLATVNNYHCQFCAPALLLLTNSTDIWYIYAVYFHNGETMIIIILYWHWSNNQFNSKF